MEKYSSPKGRLEGRFADHPRDGARKEGKSVRMYVLSVTGASGIETAEAATLTDEASGDSKAPPKAHGQLTVTSEPRLTRVPLLATLRRWRMTAGGENLTTQHRTGRRRRGEQVAR